jgi:DNA replication protein DnaC
MSLPPLPMPKPYAQRAAEDAELMASKPLVELDAGRGAPALSVGSQLTSLITQLGERRIDCARHGWYMSTGRRLGTRGLEIWSPCRGCVRADKEAELQAEADRVVEERRVRLEAVLKGTLLPERFIGQTFETYVTETPEQEHALQVVRDLAQRFDHHARLGTMLILAGGVGTGKSHLAGAAIQAVVPHHLGLYVKISGLIRMVRATWARGSERTEGEVLDDLIRVDLLAIDEIGLQYGTDAEKTLMLEVIDGRYMARKPTILLTNLDRTAFRDFVGERLFDRLTQVGRWVDFNWASFRLRARKEMGL